MKECSYCHKDLASDSTFCTYCGKQLVVTAKENKVKDQSTAREEEAKINPESKPWGKMAFFLFLVAFIGFDTIIATIINTLNIDYKFVFVISFVIYALSIICGIISFITDFKDKKNGYRASGNMPFALASIVVGLYISLLNLTAIILV